MDEPTKKLVDSDRKMIEEILRKGGFLGKDDHLDESKMFICCRNEVNEN